MKLRRILSALIIAVMAIGFVPTLSFAAAAAQSVEVDDPTYRPDHHMPFVTLNEAGNGVVLDQNKSWATRVYWGCIGEEYVEYKWFDEDFRLICGTDYFADYSPRHQEVYHFTKQGWYRFVLRAIRTGTSAEDYTYSELVFDFYYDGSVAPTVPTITELGNNQVKINYNGSPVKKFYYGNIGDKNVPYSWFNEFWGTALGTRTYTPVFDSRDERIITLQTKGYYNIVIVLEDGTEYVYTMYAKENAPVVKKVDGKEQVVIDIDVLKGNVGTKATLKKIYYGYVGEEDKQINNYDELRANTTGFSGDSNTAQGKTYALKNYGYYKFLVVATLSNGKDIEFINTVYNKKKCTHSSIKKVAASESDCYSQGNTEYWYCDDCKAYFADSSAKKEISLEDTVLPLKHGEIVIDPEVKPTYTTTGLTEGSHCGICKAVIVAQKEIPVLTGGVFHKIIFRGLEDAAAPEIDKYEEGEGLYELPVPERAGYKFLGWFTASQGGDVVDYIPAGSTKDYILYARWELITYNIRYFEVPQNNNATTYTVEDEIYLNDPNWSGLGFVGWTEADNKVKTETRNKKVYYKIPKGTTGDLELTANWKLMRNIATPGTNTIMLGEYMEESGRYMFIYELGTIENVVIEELNSSTMGLYNHTGAGDFTLTMSTENTMEESIADSITKTISKSVSSSKEWEESKEWAKEKSNEYSANASYGMEFGGDASPVKASIELGFGYTHNSSESWGGSETTGGSIGEETETGEEVGSCFSYLSSMTTTSEASVTISGDSPHGYYDYVQAGNIRVFGVVTYDPKDGNYYLNTYSILDNMHGIVLYYPDVNMLNNPTCETLEYRIPKDNIETVIENSYFISYDANGGVGKTNTSVHTVGGSEKLTTNTFTKEGYTFIGWELRDENGLAIKTFTDAQAINDALAAKGEMVKLYAIWTPNKYTIKYQERKPAGSSTEVSNMPTLTNCVYDETVTLAQAPKLSGYTFGGWYSDSGCTEENRLGDAGQVIEKANLTSNVDGVVEAYPKWTANKYTVTFDADGGSCAEASRVMIFDQLYTAAGALPTPTKANHIFLGWTLNGVELKDTDFVRIAGNHSLKAKWMSLTWSETRGNGKNKRFRMITDRDDFWTELDEDWNPGVNKKILEDHGYTKVIITISFWVDELDQGNQRVYFATPGGKEICRWSFTSTPSSWHQYTRSTANESFRYVDISNFGDNMEFKTIWEAYGNGGDDWDLGGTTVTLQFVKG